MTLTVVTGRTDLEASDFAVAKGVVAALEQLPGDRDFGDLAAAALGDPLEVLAQWPTAGGDVLGGFDQRPA
jgi:hypothetical protein